MVEDSSYLWGITIGLLIVGVPLWLWAGPISSWNRRVGSKWGWKVPADGSAGSFQWSEKYMRVIGVAATAAGLVTLTLALVRSI